MSVATALINAIIMLGLVALPVYVLAILHSFMIIQQLLRAVMNLEKLQISSFESNLKKPFLYKIS
jgi:hypothetical protein